jgi:alanine dehydrogenase
MVLLINNSEQEAVLNMKDCLDILEEAIKEEGLGTAVNRNKSVIHIPTDSPQLWHNFVSMEGAMAKTKYVALRVRSDMDRMSKNADGGKVMIKYAVSPGTFCGLVFLFSSKTAELVAILNDGYVQHMRVGATWGLGAKYSAKKESRILGLLGSGGMARVQSQAYALVRDLELIKVYSPNRAHRETFASEFASQLNGISVQAVNSPQEAVKGSDIVAACTKSLEPVVHEAWVDDGTHLSEVTQFEMDIDLLPRIDRFVNYRTGLPTQQIAGSGHPIVTGGATLGVDFQSKLDPSKVLALQDVLLGKAQGRVNENEVTLFLGDGTGVQFAAVAGKVFEKARAAGLGKELPAEWFLQNIST